MKAIGNNIIIIPKKVVTDKTKGGLFIIEKDREDIRYKEATIHSVSDNIKGVKKNDKIYYDKHAGHDIQHKDTLYRVIKSGDVVLIDT